MLTLYPAIRPYTEYTLPVDEVHTLYIEECGSPDGVPVLFLHGGPGTGFDVDNRRFFDPEKYRIILFDQRGCGKSTPHGELNNNNTQLLLQDIEKIRDHCDIDQWMLFGGSWGSTLALLYAEHYPESVLSMILNGICLGRSKDLSWFFSDSGGASHVYPDHWQDFIEPIPDSSRNNLIAAYHTCLTGDDEILSMTAAKAWSKWSVACSTLDPSSKMEKKFSDPRITFSLAKISSYYFLNNLFIEDDFILKNINKISHIPGIIIHGRYDMVCNMENAYALHNAWGKSKLRIIRDAGHSASEPGITDALVHAANELVR